ncbi:MAG: hypothetical protein PHU05_05545 [Bacilli bacterium]|nr:hypothetical protein [Bacilli bacterium]
MSISVCDIVLEEIESVFAFRAETSTFCVLSNILVTFDESSFANTV